ncbi:predicted protein [Lodderomyces elongisporus NRRL YB-4239]|uniref:Uncharacterized protein n=1 Tax=Lodderomyces elongisporus (strain ATCC 11503 / CBS 2605 / JCM 1781 / NBRC 1676 / NRRL YB-4239) TaxID=379508 RepID=A5H2P1_LODEL|nr:predicted protein [Lodderomyces elongisporus NRRL YB-4239]
METAAIPGSMVTSIPEEKPQHEQQRVHILEHKSTLRDEISPESLGDELITHDDVPIYLVYAANTRSAKKIVKDWASRNTSVPSVLKSTQNKLRADKVKQQLNEVVRQRQKAEVMRRESAPRPDIDQTMQEPQRDLESESQSTGDQSPTADSHLPFLELQFPEESMEVDPDYDYEEPSTAGALFEPSALARIGN